MENLIKVTITGHEGPNTVNIKGNYNSIESLHDALKQLLDKDNIEYYNKVFYIAHFTDGETYEGRLEISTKGHNPERYTNILIHAAGGFLMHMIQTQAEGWQDALEFIKNYSFTFKDGGHHTTTPPTAPLFDWDYKRISLNNTDGTPSRFAAIHGEGGQIVHTAKRSYTVVSTKDISSLAKALGGDISSYTHKNGEVIGLNIPIGMNATSVGDISYSAILNMPNNGTGRGVVTILEKRLICSNGMQRVLSKKQSVKIPHTADYNDYLQTAETIIKAAHEMTAEARAQDLALNDLKITKSDAKKALNVWFYTHEVPQSKKDDLSLEQFRKALATDPQSLDLPRYNELIEAYNLELGYNKTLGLDISQYTVLATVTNYLSRRIEKSKSAAPVEVLHARAASKTKSLVIA